MDGLIGKLYKVRGNSMEPTLKDGDIIEAVDAHTIKEGDIVIYYPKEWCGAIVKRCSEICGKFAWLSSDNEKELNAMDSRVFGWVPIDEIHGKIIDTIPKELL